MNDSISRRQVIQQLLKAGVVLPFIGASASSCSTTKEDAQSTTSTSDKSLRILILGGTSFLGPHQIAYALSRGHRVSTFTRGKTKPTIYQDLFDQVESLIGDRNDNLTALETGEWDLVIDNSGRKVKWTQDTATLLKDRAELYLYTSSTGVYFPYLGEQISEDTKLVLTLPEGIEDSEDPYIKMEYDYGIMKAKSELETIKAFGEERSIIVRPTYMVGPADRTDRFIYWPIRLAKGGEIFVPGPQDPVQYIDVRDVAEWMIRLAENKMAGTYNAVGPKDAQNMLGFVEEARTTFEVESTLVPVDDAAFLKAQDVPFLIPWIMPEGNNYGTARISNEKALAAGLSLRDIKESIRDIHAWWYSDALTDERRDKVEKNPKSVLMREETILEAWKERKG